MEAHLPKGEWDSGLMILWEQGQTVVRPLAQVGDVRWASTSWGTTGEDPQPGLWASIALAERVRVRSLGRGGQCALG